MELISQIVARMKAEEATSASFEEIHRCLSTCGLNTKLIKYALEHIEELNERLLDEQEHDEDWARTEDLKLENKDITYG